jgi:hypothetical protein
MVRSVAASIVKLKLGEAGGETPVEGEPYMKTHPLSTPGSIKALRLRDPFEPLPKVLQSKTLREHGTGSEKGFSRTREGNHLLRPSRFGILNGLYLISSEELETINRRISEESEPTFSQISLEPMFHLLLLESSKEGFGRVLSHILEILDRLLRSGDFHGAATVLDRLHLSLRLDSLNDWQTRRLTKAIFEAGGGKRIKAIELWINSSGRGDLDGLTRYVSLLQKNAIPHLCKLLAELKGSKPRRVICDILAQTGRESIGILGAFLDDSRWYVVRNMAYILGRIGLPECAPYLERCFDHNDSRVRQEAVHAIATVAGRETAMVHLTRKLRDTNKKVRGMAALQLARVGGGDALGVLRSEVDSRGFHKKEVSELRQFLEAIGLTGSEEAVSVLYRILVRRRFVGKTKIEEIKKAAAQALGALRTPDAIDALIEASRVGDVTARDACLAVLRRSET